MFECIKRTLSFVKIENDPFCFLRVMHKFRLPANSFFANHFIKIFVANIVDMHPYFFEEEPGIEVH